MQVDSVWAAKGAEGKKNCRFRENKGGKLGETLCRRANKTHP